MQAATTICWRMAAVNEASVQTFDRGVQLTLCCGIALLLFCRDALLIKETAPPIAAPQHRPQMASGLLQERGRLEASARNLFASPMAQDFAAFGARGGSF